MNKSRTLTKDISEKYPYYRDGMAMMYAADEKGNKTAAKAAKLAAYTEVVEKLKDIGIPKMQNPNLFANTKSSFNDAIAEIQKKYGIDTQTQKSSKTSKNDEKNQDKYNTKQRILEMDAELKDKVKDSWTNVNLIHDKEKVQDISENIAQKYAAQSSSSEKKNNRDPWQKDHWEIYNEYISDRNSSYENMQNALSKNDVKSGITVKKIDEKLYYDYTTPIMNRVNEVLPEFYEHDILSYEEYIEKYTVKGLWGIPTYIPTVEEYSSYVLGNLWFFYDQVNHGAPWDIKVDES